MRFSESSRKHQLTICPDRQCQGQRGLILRDTRGCKKTLYSLFDSSDLMDSESLRLGHQTRHTENNGSGNQRASDPKDQVQRIYVIPPNRHDSPLSKIASAKAVQNAGTPTIHLKWRGWRATATADGMGTVAKAECAGGGR